MSHAREKDTTSLRFSSPSRNHSLRSPLFSLKTSPGASVFGEIEARLLGYAFEGGPEMICPELRQGLPSHTSWPRVKLDCNRGLLGTEVAKLRPKDRQ